MKHKQLTVPIAHFKVLDEAQGIVECIPSVFSVRDTYNEQTRPGCFTKSLERKLPAICWAHDWAHPVGKTLEARELMPGDPMLPEPIRAQGGLYCKGQFNLGTQRGREAFSDLAFGTVDEFSIGYFEEETKAASDGSTDLLALDLAEWSPVLRGANPSTALIGVKSVCGSKSLPLSDRDTTWSASEARKRLKGDDTEPSAQYKRAHMICDGDETLFGSYKLPFADLIDGTLTAVWKGVTSAAGVLEGARGGVDASDSDKSGARGICETYYAKAREKYGDDTIQCPWMDDGKSKTKHLTPQTRAAAAARCKAEYLGEGAEASATFSAIYDLWYSLCYGCLYDCLFGYGEAGDMTPEECMAMMRGAFDEFRDLSLNIFDAIMGAGDEPDMPTQSPTEALAEMKRLMGTPRTKNSASPPAGEAFAQQIQTALAAVEGCIERGRAIKDIRAKNGRALSVERRAQIAKVKDALGTLLQDTAPPADTSAQAAAALRQMERKARVRAALVAAGVPAGG